MLPAYISSHELLEPQSYAYHLEPPSVSLRIWELFRGPAVCCGKPDLLGPSGSLSSSLFSPFPPLSVRFSPFKACTTDDLATRLPSTGLVTVNLSLELASLRREQSQARRSVGPFRPNS